jgi:hypothetical protein
MFTGVLPQGKIVRGVKLTTHLVLLSRLRMDGTIPLLATYAFKTGTEKYLLYFI